MANDTATHALTTKPISGALIKEPSDNEVVEVDVDATGGTFTLTFGAQTTAAIAYNATPATVESKLEALSTIGEDNIDVTGGVGKSGGGDPYVLEFVGDLAQTNVGAVTADDSSLTGGGSTVTITVVQPGASGTVVAQHLTTIVTDPEDELAVQIPDADDYPSANATELDAFSVHGEESPADVFNDND